MEGWGWLERGDGEKGQRGGGQGWTGRGWVWEDKLGWPVRGGGVHTRSHGGGTGKWWQRWRCGNPGGGQLRREKPIGLVGGRGGMRGRAVGLERRQKQKKASVALRHHTFFFPFAHSLLFMRLVLVCRFSLAPHGGTPPTHPCAHSYERRLPCIHPHPRRGGGKSEGGRGRQPLRACQRSIRPSNVSENER